MKYFLCLFLWLFLACSKEEQPGPISFSDREFALRGVGNAVIIRSFLDLQNSVNALNEFAVSYAHDSTDTKKLLTLRIEWLNAVIAWKVSSIFLQGKLGADIHSSNLYAPANAPAIENIISSGTTHFDQAFMQSLPETSSGLAAIEYLIYGTDKGNAEPVISAFNAAGSRRGAFLRALCLDLKRRSDQLLYQWSIAGDGYLNQFIASSGPGHSASLGVLADNMIATVSRIRDERLGTPLGVKEGPVRPELVEAKFSGESVTLIRAELLSVEQIFTGWKAPGMGAKTLFWLLDQAGARSGDVALSAAIEAQFADIESKLSLIKTPLEQAVTNNPRQVRDVYDAVGKLQQLIENEVVAGLHFRE